MRDPLADALTTILQREGLTQEQMAKRIDVTPSYLSRVLSGKRGVGRKLLDNAASAFPELLTAHAASLTIRDDSTAKTPRGN
jgi:transcriptional regulator with XRE-family HTH domain